MPRLDPHFFIHIFFSLLNAWIIWIHLQCVCGLSAKFHLIFPSNTQVEPRMCSLAIVVNLGGSLPKINNVVWDIKSQQSTLPSFFPQKTKKKKKRYHFFFLFFFLSLLLAYANESLVIISYLLHGGTIWPKKMSQMLKLASGNYSSGEVQRSKCVLMGYKSTTNMI